MAICCVGSQKWRVLKELEKYIRANLKFNKFTVLAQILNAFGLQMVEFISFMVPTIQTLNLAYTDRVRLKTPIKSLSKQYYSSLSIL